MSQLMGKFFGAKNSYESVNVNKKGDSEDTNKDHATFGFWTGVAFTVNYIMGCGFLSLPSAFYKTGMVFGPLMVILFGFIMNVSKDYMLETMGRVEALHKAEKIAARDSNGAGEARGASSTSASDIIVPEQNDYIVVTERKFEVAELFATLVGKRARTIYVAILSLYMYGALIAYSQVFASSVAANIPVVFFNDGKTCNIENDLTPEEHSACLGPFYTWLVLFALVAVPAACMELKEQLWLQIVMFFARILVVLLMSITVLASWTCDGVSFLDMGSSKDARPTDVTLFNLSGLTTLLPIATYSFIFHHSVPILSEPIKDKTSLPRVFLGALAVCCLAYTSLGLVVALGFGNHIHSQANLNWQNYVGCNAPGETKANFFAAFVRFIILIFPALDVLSAFPLNAVTLGNGLVGAFFGDSAKYVLNPELEVPQIVQSQLPTYASTPRKRKYALTSFRLLAAVPPLIAVTISARVGVNLETILKYTGLVGVGIAFAIPSLLRLHSWIHTRRVFSLLSKEGAMESTLGSSASDPLVPAASDDSLSASALLPRFTRVKISWSEIIASPWKAFRDHREGTDPVRDITLPKANVLIQTPYTSATVMYSFFRGDLVMFLFSIAVAIFILVGLIRPEHE